MANKVEAKATVKAPGGAKKATKRAVKPAARWIGFCHIFVTVLVYTVEAHWRP